MALRTALTFGSPFSIRLMSNATVRTLPLRTRFIRLFVISWVRRTLEYKSNRYSLPILHYPSFHSPYSITPFFAATPSRSPSAESLKFPRQSHRFWHHESIVPQDSL